MQQRCFNVNRPPISLSPFSRPNSENYAMSRVGGEEGSGLINEPVIAWFKDRSLVVRGGCDLNIIANYRVYTRILATKKFSPGGGGFPLQSYFLAGNISLKFSN